MRLGRRLVVFLLVVLVQTQGQALDKCPICRMQTLTTWYVEMAYGQRIFTCSMTDGNEYTKGKHYFSHPALLAAKMNDYISTEPECNNSCPNCHTNEVKDPTNGAVISDKHFAFACLTYGQKIYFANEENKKKFLDNVPTVPFLYVSGGWCGDRACPDFWKSPGGGNVSPSPNLPTTPNSGSNTSSFTSSNEFCSGATAMFNGFKSMTAEKSCVLLLFQPWILNSHIKYIFSLLGVFLLAVFNEAFVAFRGYAKGRVQRLVKNAKVGLVANPDSNSHRKIYLRQKMSGKIFLSFLYFIQMSLAYFLMLIAMIYEIGLFVMLVLGFGCGFFLFKTFEDTPVEIEEAGLLLPPDCILFKIEGMKCMQNCGQTVERALREVPGVESATVLFSQRKVAVVGNVDINVLIEAIAAVGFEARLDLTAKENV